MSDLPLDAWSGDDPLAMAEQRAERWRLRYERAGAAYREAHDLLARVEGRLDAANDLGRAMTAAVAAQEERAEKAEAALARVRALADEWEDASPDDEWDAAGRWHDAPNQIRTALDREQP